MQKTLAMKCEQWSNNSRHNWSVKST